MSFEPDAKRNGGDRGFGARGTSGTGPDGGPGRALVRVAPAGKTRYSPFTIQHGVWAAGLVLAIGLGAVGLESVKAWNVASTDAARKFQADATAQLLHRLEDEVGHLKGSVDTLRASAQTGKQEDSLRGLRRSVDALKQEIEQVRSNDGSALAQLSTKLDKADHDPSAKLAEISSRLDKLDRDPSQKLADVASRLDRIEHQVASPMPTGSLPAAPHAAPAPVRAPAPRTPTAAGSAAKEPTRQQATVVPVSEPKSEPPKAATVDGWVVRDVYDGMALVEARRGGVREIAPGEFLPGAGEVRSIERRGRSWVVLTSRGVIEASTW